MEVAVEVILINRTSPAWKVLALVLILCIVSCGPTPGELTREDPEVGPTVPGQKPDDKKDNGDDPRDTPPPEIFGEEIDDSCELVDIDIFKPAAQDSNMTRITEALDASEGAWTIRNDDMDAPTASIITDRLHDRMDLLKVDGKPDLEMAAVPGENDLVKIELLNPDQLTDVFFCAYAMANELRGRSVRTNAGFQGCRSTSGKLKIWRTATRTGPVNLPHQSAGPVETLWVEGLKAGRYRLVLFQLPDGTLQKAAAVKAKEPGKPHGRKVDYRVELKPKLECYRNVRMTVAAVNIRQDNRREHVFDILWGGRAVVDGYVWPGGGTFLWTTSGGLNGTWETGKVHGIDVKSRDTAPAGMNKIQRIHGGFAPAVTGVGLPVTGTTEYSERFVLKYRVEGVFLERYEPVTLMVPHRVTVRPPDGDLTRLGTLILGGDYSVSWSVTYSLFDQIGQNGRLLVGQKNKKAYKRQYGSRLQMYEALGMGTNAVEDARERVSMNYVSPILAARTFTIRVGTKQRRQAIPSRGSLSDATFTDNFRLSLSNPQRGIVQQDIRQNSTLAGQNIFQVRQDVVVLLKNGITEYDVRVARNQVLEIKGPAAPASTAAPFGGLGFRLQLGSGGGTTPSTGNPDRVASTHNPQ